MKPFSDFSEEKKTFLRDHFYSKNLSKCEVEVVILVLQGHTNSKVASELCVAEKTVKFHLTNVYKKLNISRRTEIVWTLPLADFIKIEEVKKEASNPAVVNINSETKDKENSEDIFIPAGSSTINDM
ncbi:MAG: helix-turn-helix domain-containing protein [Bdellovibrionales bacterium]